MHKRYKKIKFRMNTNNSMNNKSTMFAKGTDNQESKESKG